MARKKIDVEEQLRRVAQLGPDFQQVVALAELGRVVQVAMAQVNIVRRRQRANGPATTKAVKGPKKAAVHAAAAAAEAAKPEGA